MEVASLLHSKLPEIHSTLFSQKLLNCKVISIKIFHIEITVTYFVKCLVFVIQICDCGKVIICAHCRTVYQMFILFQIKQYHSLDHVARRNTH